MSIAQVSRFVCVFRQAVGNLRRAVKNRIPAAIPLPKMQNTAKFALAIGRGMRYNKVRHAAAKGNIMETVRRNKEIDMLNGPIWNKLPRFALPVAATAVLSQLFNASDVAVVGNFTGELRNVSVAAVGANSAIIGLFVNLFVGISLGVNVVIANAIGRGERETVHRATHTSVLSALLLGIAVTVFGELLAPGFLSLLRTPEDVFPYALLYLRIYLLGAPVILLYNFEAAIFRSAGDTRTPLLALTFSGVLNVLLNLFFVAVLRMTVEGVAIATVLSNAVSAAILYSRLRKHGGDIHLEPKQLRIHRRVLGRILRIGVPAGVQSAMFAVSNIVIQAAVNALGTTVMAASSAAYNVEVFAYYTMNGFTQACTTFVGQNYGAGQPARCKKTLKLSLLEASVALGTVIALMLVTGRFLLSLFNRDPAVVELGYSRLVLVFIAYPFTMLYEMFSGYLRGFGHSLVPAVLTVLGICGVRIAWVLTAFPQNPTFNTIMYAYPISLFATALFLSVAALCYHPASRLEKAKQAERA